MRPLSEGARDRKKRRQAAVRHRSAVSEKGYRAGIQASEQAALRKQAVGNMAGGKRKRPCGSVK